MMSDTDIHYFPDLAEASASAVNFITNLAKTEIKRKNSFTFVLTGGKTPRLLYELLAQPIGSAKINWQQVSIFWGDERCLDLKHVDSNFNMAHETLLSKINIPAQNIYRIPTELSSPIACAYSYEQTLRNFFKINKQSTTLPSFDLILLGMGQDGHIASLFPCADSLMEKNRWVTAETKATGSPAAPRITLTMPVINQAGHILFLIAGTQKQQIARKTFITQQNTPYNFPAALVRPTDKLTWFIAAKT